jgi:hypothetical protein
MGSVCGRRPDRQQVCLPQCVFLLGCGGCCKRSCAIRGGFDGDFLHPEDRCRCFYAGAREEEGARPSETFANGVEIPMKNSAHAVAEVLAVGSAVRKFRAR